MLDAYIVDNRYIVENWYQSACTYGQCDEECGATVYDKWKNKVYMCSFIAEDDIELYSTLETRSEIIIDTHIQDVINNYSNLFV